MVQATLPATKSQSARGLLFDRSSGEVLIQAEEVSKSGKVSRSGTEVYSMRQISCGKIVGFLVKKVTGSGSKEEYRVECVKGGHSTCTCKGFRFGGRCKHADAFGELVAKGLL
jgi:hypothetical protein